LVATLSFISKAAIIPSLIGKAQEGVMLDYMLMPLKRYAEFSGRSRRKEFWFFVLFVIAGVILLSIIEGALGLTGMVGGVYGPLTTLFYLAILIPCVAVIVRRLHDQDKSGWWALLGLVPIANLVLLVFMFLDGTNGPNQYGPDPKAGERGTAPA
jgi:uncharacterized membrane protein YhaH (DUF805 family)